MHGNADRSVSWDSDITGPVGDSPAPARSVYDEFRSAGYNGCELFGITFLTPQEQRDPQLNYHQPAKYRLILDFIAQVKAFTGAPRVDVVAHSLGVSMTLAALTWHDETGTGAAGWGDVRRFVNIAGGLHGLSACRRVGFANPLVSTCGSQNLLDPYVFGFHQDGNAWTAAEGQRSLRTVPARYPDVDFYTIHAGAHDQVHCGPGADAVTECRQGALFADAPNVQAQLDVGAGSTGPGRPGHDRRQPVRRPGRRSRRRRTLQGQEQHRRHRRPDADHGLRGARLPGQVHRWAGDRGLITPGGHRWCRDVSGDSRGRGGRTG